jgi:hypothetical protein
MSFGPQIDHRPGLSGRQLWGGRQALRRNRNAAGRLVGTMRGRYVLRFWTCGEETG